MWQRLHCSEGRGGPLGASRSHPQPGAVLCAAAAAAAGRNLPSLAAATRHRARRPHSHRALGKASSRPQPWPGCRLGRRLGRLGRLKPRLGELASISRAADAAPVQYRGASPSTLLYSNLLTHHSLNRGGSRRGDVPGGDQRGCFQWR